MYLACGGLFMCYIIAKIASLMQYIYATWHCAWWNYHINQARLHDDYIKRLDPEWREKT